LDKCKAADISEFRHERGDVIVVHDIRLRSASDLYDLKAAAKTSVMAGLFSRARKPEDFRLVLTCQDNECPRGRSFFHKIHLPGGGKKGAGYFACPNPVGDLRGGASKPNKVAGILGSIRRENQPEHSIEKAIQDGMNKVIIYGYLADPRYLYASVVPLAKTYPGKIGFAGFIDDRQKLYDSVSDVYTAKASSVISRECRLTGTRFHGPASPVDEAMNNDEILDVWVRELGLR
jgi:hypothetical protein